MAEPGPPPGPVPTSLAAVPAVVVVMVARDPGPWFEATLGGIADQDYSNLSVLVVDAASEIDPTPRVHGVLPQAFVRRLDHNPGFGPAVNVAIDAVSGADFLLICHDDIELTPNTVRVLVEEAFRNNAAILGPKIVDWQHPNELLQVGLEADKFGVSAPIAEPHELDQEQYDAVRDVFHLPGAATLVRADLFRELGGFDPEITFLGEDLDLCWRAHVMGARVLVVPDAVCRHLEALGGRRPADDRRRLQFRHRMRTMGVVYTPLSKIRVFPQLAVLIAVEMLYSVLVGRVGHARDLWSAFTWNLSRTRDTRRRHRQLDRLRQVPDSEVRRLQARGSARLTAFVRGQIGVGDDRRDRVAETIRRLRSSVDSAARRDAVVAIGVLTLIVLVGSRQLLTGGIPTIGELAPLGDDARDLLGAWFTSYRTDGLGAVAAAPSLFFPVGLLGHVFLGRTGLLHTVVVLGALPLGAVGAWRLGRSMGSSRAAAVATVVHVGVAVPWNALESGRWNGLAAWAAAPWVLRLLAASLGAEPFTRRDALWSPGVRLALVLALTALVAPVVVPVTVGVAAAFILGSILSGRLGGIPRLVVAVVVGAVGALLLHLPWAVDLITGGSDASEVWAMVVGARPAGPDGLGFGEILRLDTGSSASSVLTWFLLAGAAYPLLLGRGWRLAWATRWWTIATVGWLWVWAVERGWVEVAAPAHEVVLGVVAAALAGCAALGMTVFTVDLREYHFGWRQVASVLALTAVLVGVLPMVGAAAGGRWSTPSRDIAHAAAFLAEEVAEEPFRVAWVGTEAAVAGGWPVFGEVRVQVTPAGTPEVGDVLPSVPTGRSDLLVDALEASFAGRTSRLGELLAPLGVRYVVVQLEPSPAPYAFDAPPLPPRVVDGLTRQLDLTTRIVDPTLLVFENSSWVGMRAEADLVAPEDVGGLAALDRVMITDPTSVLPQKDGTSTWTGPIGGRDVFVAEDPAADWRLEVDGRVTEGESLADAAVVFRQPGTGTGELVASGAGIRWVVAGAQTVLWLLVLLAVARARRTVWQDSEAGSSGARSSRIRS
ncbi:MAG: glycosyltransferase [Actinomycetia bacterium]|nr:glycosyltransferase [Actinomycetes bacterium]